MDETREQLRLVCTHCGVEIDCCEFCDGEECAKAVCYGCVIIEIGQEISALHPHGG